MNSKKNILLALGFCGLVMVLEGCCCMPKPKSSPDYPQITSQPDNVNVVSNKTTHLSVGIDGKDNYLYEWKRLVPLPPCPKYPECNDSDDVSSELQTNRIGWDTDTLQIAHATLADEGYYYCTITPISCFGLPLPDFATQTRVAYVKVFDSVMSPKSPGGQQVASRQLQSYPNSPASFCGFTPCKAYCLFQVNDSQGYFTSGNAGPCQITADQIDNTGAVLHSLTTLEFDVMAVVCAYSPPNPPTSTIMTICATNLPPKVRQFTVKANTTYFFQFGVVTPPQSLTKYKITVNFPQ